jgi:hypothetical protein
MSQLSDLEKLKAALKSGECEGDSFERARNLIKSLAKRRYKLANEEGYVACSTYPLCGICDECLRDVDVLKY